RHEREVVPVVMIVEIKDAREAGPGPRELGPSPVLLRVEQVQDAAADGDALPLACRDEAHERPGGLAGRRGADALFAGMIVAGDALAPAAVAVLPRLEPADGAPDVGRLQVLADGLEAAQHLPGAVEVVHAPAAVPAPFGG